MPMPMARAPAAANNPALPVCCAARANDRPTAMPSGMLCSVTARTSSVVRRKEDGRPSACSAPLCRCGMNPSSASISTRPRIKPPAAGIQSGWPFCAASSIAGMSRLQMDAAIITPDANPRKICCIRALDCRFIKNTMAAPIVVIRKVKPVPAAAQSNVCCIIRTSLFNWLVIANYEHSTEHTFCQ